MFIVATDFDYPIGRESAIVVFGSDNFNSMRSVGRHCSASSSVVSWLNPLRNIYTYFVHYLVSAGDRPD